MILMVTGIYTVISPFTHRLGVEAKDLLELTGATVLRCQLGLDLKYPSKATGKACCGVGCD